jgi:Ca-activated chloride channel family protein
VVGAPGLATLFAAALFCNSAAAQQADSKPPAAGHAATQSGAGTPPASPSSIQVRVNVVNVPVSVLSKNGVPVIDMAKNEFQVFEDGREQAIKYFFYGARPPLRIGLILDTSNSARRQLQFEKDAAQEFIFQMLQGRSSKNQIFLQTFDATSSLLQDFTNDPEVLNEKIMDLKAGGGKALYDAIYTACREKMLNLGPPSESRRVLVVVTDGLDAQSHYTLEEALSMAHKAETIIYTLGITAYGYDNPGDAVLKEMAEATGGAALFPREKTPGTNLDTGYLSHGQIGETSQNKGLGASTGIYSAERLEQLADSMEAIGRELAEQYNIGYTPLNDKLDGTYRTIRVIALRKGVEVRAKTGYFAIAQP